MRLHRLQSLLERQWQQAGWLSDLLLPLTALTRLAIAYKSYQYRWGWKRSFRAPLPIVVVGNIYIGGTGKTPLIIAIVQALQARGWRPGVVSRGYGIKISGPPRVGRGKLCANYYGDEPTLIAQMTAAAIAVHPRRVWAVQALCERYPEINVIVSDDGLQHLALSRDIEIIVQDERGCGNGRLLPAGPLRESPKRLTQVDAVITRYNSYPSLLAVLPFLNHRSSVRQVNMLVQAERAICLTTQQEYPLTELAKRFHDQRIVAVAGIGHPQRFFNTLQATGIKLSKTIALADHDPFLNQSFDNINADVILITEKDKVKCFDSKDPRIWFVPLKVQLSDSTFFDWLAYLLHKRQSIIAHSISKNSFI